MQVVQARMKGAGIRWGRSGRKQCCTCGRRCAARSPLTSAPPPDAPHFPHDPGPHPEQKREEEPRCPVSD